MIPEIRSRDPLSGAGTSARRRHNGWLGLLEACFCLALTQAANAAAPVQASSGYVAVQGSRLYYEECGTAPQSVVLIHDGVVDSAVWDDVWPQFCARFHTIRYDRRGYGRSPEGATYYFEVDDLAELLQHLKVMHVTLVGSSHGGELSIDFTLAHPEWVEQLVLVGPVVSGMPYSQHFLDRGRHAFELLDKGDVEGAISEWSQDHYLIAPGNDAARRRLLALLRSHPQDMTHHEHLLRPKAALPRLGEIRVPTLILTGDADIPDVQAHSGAIEVGIPSARRIVLAGVGHIMYLEKPAEFSRWAIDFIELNARSRH
jgi:3-oxoadipate enol-lactonase